MGYTQMGGEGANWVGEAPFSKRRHVFQNIGDGTYYHSGLLAIRAAIAAGVNITFKILYNDAVAMTGGQSVDGPLYACRRSPARSRPRARCQVVVVTDEPDKYPLHAGFAPGVTIRHRDELDAVQRELREVEGTTVLVYDQTCAAEKRRRRKRGQMADPPRRVVINELVCEGCGDCGLASNCVSIVPVETEFGRKRQIDQSSCNKDYSCLEGFCPSFVTVEGAELRKGRPAPGDEARPRAAARARAAGARRGLRHRDRRRRRHRRGHDRRAARHGGPSRGQGCGGARHDRPRPEGRCGDEPPADRAAARTTSRPCGSRPAARGCCSAAIWWSPAATRRWRRWRPERGHAVVNTQPDDDRRLHPPGRSRLPGRGARARRSSRPPAERAAFVDATRLAVALLGDAIATNLFMVGFAYQQGLLPVSAAAIERAIELNRVAAAMNRRAFRWGRLAALDPAAVEARGARRPRACRSASGRPRASDEAIARRVAFLDRLPGRRLRRALPRRWSSACAQVEAARAPGRSELTEAVARYYFKLLAYKDEYEVARLYTNGEFRARLAGQFEGRPKLRIHLAPPLFAAARPGDRRAARSAPMGPGC